MIDACGQPRHRGRGHPLTATVRVLAALRRFLREGTPWRSLIATTEQASGATLRRSLRHWAETGVLAQVHAMLVGMLRGHPDLILDTCSVRQARGRPYRPEPDGSRQAGHQVSCRGGRDRRPCRRHGHGCQCQRHARL